MEVFSIALVAALVGKIMSVVKAIGKDWNMVVTQGGIWGVGIVVVSVAAHTHWAGATVLQGVALSDMNWADLGFVGVCIGSGISQVYDFKKARDNTDTASEPPLLVGVKAAARQRPLTAAGHEHQA